MWLKKIVEQLTKRCFFSIIRKWRCGCGGMADALVLGASVFTWGFESLHPHQFFSKKELTSRSDSDNIE